MKINRLTSIALAALALALVSSQLVAQTSYSQETKPEVRSQNSGVSNK